MCSLVFTLSEHYAAILKRSDSPGVVQISVASILDCGWCRLDQRQHPDLKHQLAGKDATANKITFLSILCQCDYNIVSFHCTLAASY